MNAFLSIQSTAVAFGDAAPNSNPSLKYFDWKRSLSAVPIDNPRSESLALEPGETRVVFNGSRTTTIDGTTQFVLTASTLDPARYRFAHGTGTVPGLRTDRSLATSGIALVLVANLNGTLTMTAGSGTPFSVVSVGDTIFIPGPTTGDTTAGFNTLNEGEWVVLGKNDTVLTLVRSGEGSGVAETVTPASNAILAYSSTGVQVGDKVDLTGGFASTAQKTFEVVAVTSKRFEVISTSPLAPESAIPGVAGIAFYSNGKRFLRVESDQDCVVRVNGDTGNFNRASPFVAGGVGHYEKIGPTWSLSLVNRSSVAANVTVISAE